MQIESANSGAMKQYTAQEIVYMLGEELKKPLTTIKALSELNQNSAANSITLEVKKALRTIDNVLLHQQLTDRQTYLDLGPIHIGSTLTDVANDLKPLSISYGCDTEVFIQSGLSSVHAHPAALKSGLESLWQAVLQMTLKPSTMTWHVYKSHIKSEGVRISLTNSSIDLSDVSLGASSTKNAGHSKQPITGVSGSSTDLLTASNFFHLVGGKLQKTKKDGKTGFAVTLPLSTQLSFV